MSELVYIFGKHAVAEALRAKPAVVKDIALEASFSDRSLLGLIERAKKPTKILNPKKLPGGLRPDATHQGVVAAIDVSALMVPYKAFIEATAISPSTGFLVLGEVQDPHNVGAVIRSAAAFGIAGVMIPPHNQAPVTGTVIKVSAGMAFRIPLVEIRNVNATLADLKKRGCWVYGLAGEAEAVPLPTESFDRPAVFVLGNEGEGLRAKTREHCDTLLSIPMHPQCESLNAAAAAATVMYAWSVAHPPISARA